ncbi:MAG: hypothetical protein AAGC92_15925 [Pseudomonadota bacterium]
MVRRVQEIMDRYCEAFENGDFAAFVERCCLPFVSVWDQETLILRDHAALRRLFDREYAAIRHMPGLRIDYELLTLAPQGARLLSAVTILSGKINGNPAIDPVTVVKVLRMENDEWRLGAVMNPLMARLAQHGEMSQEGGR